MTLNLNDNPWAKTGFIAAALIAVIGLWSYLAGGIFMTVFGYKFGQATPFSLFQYWYFYGSNAQAVKWIYIASGISLVIVASPCVWLFSPAKRSLFGDAKFATRGEIKKAGLLGEEGIIVGKLGYHYLMFGGSQHAIISAPTRSGKGVSVVIPNLLNWPDSVVVLDIKQENWGITSGYRSKHGQPCFLFNPAAADYRTHRYNPLAYISEDPNFRIDDAQKIAGMLFPDQPGVDLIWTATPRSLFLGVVLFLLETPNKLVTLGQVLRETLADGDGSDYFTKIITIRKLGERIRECSSEDAKRQAVSDLDIVLTDKGKAQEHHPRLAEMAVWYHLSEAYRQKFDSQCGSDSSLPGVLAATEFDRASAEVGKALSPACIRSLNTYISIASENTRAGVMTSFRSRLELWMNPLIDAATSANDFDLRDIRKRRMSIYLGVTPDNLRRLRPLLNLFFQQLLDLNTRELPSQNKDLKYKCLLLMDEFTAIGKIEALSDGISYIAGYGLRMMPIIQSPAQTVDIYGQHAAQTFTTNHALNMIFSPKASETQTARDISEWLGYQTVKGKSESKGKGIFSKKAESESTSDQRRAMMLPQEITSLGAANELVVMENLAPVLAKKIKYYKERAFMDRLKEVSPKLRAIGSKLPSQRQLEAAIQAGELGAHVPKIDLAAHHLLVGSDHEAKALSAIPPNSKAKTVSIERPVAPEDIGNLAKLSLASFVVDFSAVETPQAGDLDVAAMADYADRLCMQADVKL